MPAFTKLGLVNKALIKIGAKTITALASTDEPNAVIMNEIYDQCRDEVLEEYPWSFATNTVPLVQLNPSAWVTATSYTVGVYVKQSNLIYICAIAHTSGTFATDLTAGDWVLQSGYVPLLLALPVMNDGISVAYAIPSDFMTLYLVSIRSAQIRIETLKSPIVTTTVVALLSDTVGLIVKYIFNNDDPTTYSAKFYEALACKLAWEACFKISEAAQYAAKVESDYTKALLSAMTADSKNQSPDQPIANEWFYARLAGSGGSVVGLPNGNIGWSPDPYNP